MQASPGDISPRWRMSSHSKKGGAEDRGLVKPLTALLGSLLWHIADDEDLDRFSV